LSVIFTVMNLLGLDYFVFFYVKLRISFLVIIDDR